MKVFAEVFTKSLTKKGEELCGDSVEVVQSEDGIIAVMADGLGSGVKASILSTLTVRIASTMIKNRASIEEVVKTIINTLPVCRVRQLAYSTFSILEIDDDGKGRLFEFDNPAVIYLRDGRVMGLPCRELKVENRRILEYRFEALPGDKVFLVSDGVIHAGVGGILNLGWQWSNVAEYLQRLDKRGCFAAEMVDQLIRTCSHLYFDSPGDDTTVVGVGIRKPEPLTVLVGPPRGQGKGCRSREKTHRQRREKGSLRRNHRKYRFQGNGKEDYHKHGLCRPGGTSRRQYRRNRPRNRRFDNFNQVCRGLEKFCKQVFLFPPLPGRDKEKKGRRFHAGGPARQPFHPHPVSGGAGGQSRPQESIPSGGCRRQAQDSGGTGPNPEKVRQEGVYRALLDEKEAVALIYKMSENCYHIY
ncbi:stage II sporulation protein E [Thermosediminibacter litoriperuensis]|uniref:Stage II sporulation protein E n=1 Tax=Thermosediminibacter litoriperuensis TaxID=291989 RepID=A0A5S5AU28_9FIRM|nr:stage II sporulation protein E [Thermosediminibacter litoriperuensis]